MPCLRSHQHGIQDEASRRPAISEAGTPTDKLEVHLLFGGGQNQFRYIGATPLSENLTPPSSFRSWPIEYTFHLPLVRLIRIG